VQEVKQVQGSVQERLEVLEGRQQSEEAYLSSLQVQALLALQFTSTKVQILTHISLLSRNSSRPSSVKALPFRFLA